MDVHPFEERLRGREVRSYGEDLSDPVASEEFGYFGVEVCIPASAPFDIGEEEDRA